MRALISGVSGQDGSYLAEYLLSLGYEVFGIIRRQSVAEHQDSRLDHLAGKVTTYYGDLTDVASLMDIVGLVKPDEVYNLAAMSHVRVSFDVPAFTSQVNAIGALNMIDACRAIVPRCRYYQASSSEMFGTSVDEDRSQRETTPMCPTSPYGVAKVFAYNTVRHYRRAYKMHATNGILFNHESPRRGSNFVTAKIVKGAVMIHRRQQRQLELGNLDSQRDWGHSKDYCIDFDTPILTPNGWAYYADVEAGTEIINFNLNTGKLERDRVLKKVQVQHEGTWVVLSGRGYHLRCTPNHRILYQQKSKSSKGGWSKWKETTAAEFYARTTDRKLRARYDYRLPPTSGYGETDLAVTDAELRMVGYLLAEGHCAKSRPGGGVSVSISQSFLVNERVALKIEEDIASLGLVARRHDRQDGVSEWVFDTESSTRLVELIGSYNVHIMPRWCYGVSGRQAEVLFSALMDCDGCWGSMTYTSKRSLLAADVQSIAHLAGRRTTGVTRQKDGMYRVSLISHESRGRYPYVTDVSLEKTSDTAAWCVSTENGTIVTRSNNQISVSGNCRAMHLMLQQSEPGDWVVATGETYSVRDLCERVFSKLGMDYREFVVQNPRYMRPEELPYLRGDSTRIRALGWEPTFTFDTLVDDLLAHWLKVVPA